MDSPVVRGAPPTGGSTRLPLERNPASTLPNAFRQIIADGVARHSSSLTESERASWIHTVEGLLDPGEVEGFQPFLVGIKRHSRLHVRSRQPSFDQLDDDSVVVDLSSEAPPTASQPSGESSDGKRLWRKGPSKRD